MQFKNLKTLCAQCMPYLNSAYCVKYYLSSFIYRFSSTGKLAGGHQAAVMCLAVAKLSKTEDIVVTGSKDHYIKVFEVNGESGGVFSPKMNLKPPHYDGIQSLALHGDILFSGSRDMCIKKWNLAKQELIQVIFYLCNCNMY